MKTLQTMAGYNRWANAQVFSRCGELELDDELGKSLRETLAHSLMVEDVYLAAMRGDEVDVRRLRATYEGQSLAWMSERATTIADGYDALLADADEAFLAGTFQLPWFKAPMTRREGVLQAFLHANHHRSQVFSILGERGHAVPDLDYLLMAQGPP
jgi:uncharacterized damage-inducible protein DinB